MKKTSDGKTKPVVLVTGGASFLGRAISLRLAEGGFDLVLHYQNSREKTEALAQETRRLGAETLLVKADLRKAGQAPLLVRRAGRHFKRLDLLVNNASLFSPTPLSDGTPGPWLELFNVNLFAPYFLSRAAFPWLKKAGGSIVNMTDIYGENPALKDYSAYCASKSALMTLTRFLARELGPRVRVNAVSPGAIFIPKGYSRKKRNDLLNRSALRRQGTPEDIAEAVYFLASQSFVTGQILKVDGGRFA